MADELRWVFDPLPPSGAVTGGDLASYVFRPSLGTFVREVIQNSNDQRSGTEPVEVEFAFHVLRGEHKAALLRALGWEELLPHLQAVSVSNSLIAGRVSDVLAEDEGLTVLAVHDRNTRGLVGGEDDLAGNFAPLCRHKLVTTEDKVVSGGSHGLGKAVLWSFSAISTVAFASVLDDDSDPGPRYIVRAELPFHRVDGSALSGAGWYGEPEAVNGGERAESVWGDAAYRAILDSPLARDDEATGTTVLVPFFFEPEVEGGRPIDEVATDVLRSVSAWFWPSLEQGSLRVLVSVNEDGVSIMQAEPDPMDDFSSFVGAAREEVTGDRAIQPLDVAERPIKLRPPNPKDAGDALEGEVLLRVQRAAEDDLEHPRINTIALVRGARMVVKYYRPRHLPIEGEGFFGVLLAGLGHGGADSDEAIEQFLRAAEPPEHNDWIPATNNLRSRYKAGARARLEELFSRIDALVLDMCRQAPDPGEAGPALLAKLLPLGKEGPPPTSSGSKFATEVFENLFDPPEWTVRARTTRRRGNKAWAVTGTLRLEAESGSGAALRLINVSADVGDVALEKSQRRLRVKLPSDADEVTLSVTAAADGADQNIAQRARLRADFTPHEEV